MRLGECDTERPTRVDTWKPMGRFACLNPSCLGPEERNVPIGSHRPSSLLSNTDTFPYLQEIGLPKFGKRQGIETEPEPMVRARVHRSRGAFHAISSIVLG